MNRSQDSASGLPGWARAADVLTVVLILTAAYVTLFGGIRIGTVFSMSTPWRALGGLVVIVALRHYLVRASPLHQRVRSALREAPWLLEELARRSGSSRAAGLAASLGRSIDRVRERFALFRPLPSEAPNTARFEALHVVALWGMAVAQPIFDVVGRSPEFFIAHDARPGELLALVVVLCLAGPALCLLLIHLAGRTGGWRWRRRAAAAVIGALAGAVALAAFKSLGGWPDGRLVALAVLAAAAAAVAYQRLPPVRTFASFLTPAAIVVPVVFLLNPGVDRVLAPAGESGALEGVTFASTPPVVVVVFDQFQLAALLDPQGDIDRETFPNFAALADEATWFRNATGVAGLTAHALPAVLTGMYPEEGLLPVVADHPASLFTLVGSRYRLHVEEPLTDLCPESLCPRDRPGLGAWLYGVLRDLAIVYLRVVLPDELAAPLPPVNQTWNNFAANAANEQSRTFQDRWRAARRDDRRRTADRFIESITATRGPALHFLHVLLPHEPWLYLPTGQQFTFQRHNIGLRDGKWADDPWAAALNYQRYLLQAGYADTLLGRLMARLRETGIYDETLLVVTADHGASLRAGMSFRRPDESSFEEIAAVPLLLKRPAQQRGAVVDTNVEVIDIVPTLAAELGVELPWTADGANVLDPAHAPRASKLMFFDNARRRMEVQGDLTAAVIEGARRRFAVLRTGNPLDVPTPGGRYDKLIGQAADPLRIARPADIEVVVDALPLLQDVDPDADFVPAHITGAVVDLPDGAPPPALAIAVNGTVAAVTRPYSFPVVGRRSAWEAIIPPSSYAAGPNTLEVFEVREYTSDGAMALAVVRGDMATNRVPNLVREEELQALGGRSSGFYGTEWGRSRSFRWTRGDARLVVPVDPRSPPEELAVDVLLTGGEKQLRIAVDDCLLFDQAVAGRWNATFDLRECGLSPPEVEIVLESDTHIPGTRDTRRLGVGLGRVELRGAASEP